MMDKQPDDTSQPQQNNQTEGALDWTALSSDDSKVVKPSWSPSDTKKLEDNARAWIAYSLIALLFVIIIGVLLLLMIGRIAVTDIKEISAMFTPVVALVSAATGFYYGAKSTADTQD